MKKNFEHPENIAFTRSSENEPYYAFRNDSGYIVAVAKKNEKLEDFKNRFSKKYFEKVKK